MVRAAIVELTTAITPLDSREAADRQKALDWIASTADIFRTQKPDVPQTHLVSYFVLVDPEAQKILLVDHIKAGLWLPAGGHVEPNEDPAETVRRECVEELQVPAVFMGYDEGQRESQAKPQPLFITATITNGQGQHTDVSLWYVLQATADDPAIVWDPREFKNVQWWTIHDIMSSPIKNFDPELHRFCTKLQTELARG